MLHVYKLSIVILNLPNYLPKA
ncbi:MAG: hypothetical protein PWR03_2199, partial [Tenuifilum sp.]|nr:hypothetical protein [Tenuifilum sp.]